MKTEKTLTAIFLISVILKFIDLPGASLLLIFSLLFLSLLYFLFAFYFFPDKNLKQQNLGLSITGGIAISLLVIGILFKLMFWPGSSITLLAGILLTFIIGIIIFKFSGKTDESLKIYYKNFITRIVFWLGLALCFYYVPGRQLLEIQYRNDPELLQLKINAYSDSGTAKDQEALDNYYKRRDSLQLLHEQPH